MGLDAVFRFRVDPAMRRLLDRLRDERDVNVSAWVRRRIRADLEREFPGQLAAQDAGAQPPAPRPLEGWKPCRIGGGWGAVFRGDSSALPADLVGTRIEVAPRNGNPWVATVTEIVERSPEHVVVRDSGKPPQ